MYFKYKSVPIVVIFFVEKCIAAFLQVLAMTFSLHYQDNHRFFLTDIQTLGIITAFLVLPKLMFL